MPLLKNEHTSDEYWNLPDRERAELIGGQFYNMAPPSRIHQELVSELTQAIGQYVKAHGGACKVYPAPFAVNLDAEDKEWVEPDISVICDKNKLTDRGCSGAPDWIIEIVSPSSQKMDYIKKAALYSETGVREYWVVDPQKSITLIYQYEKESAPTFTPFDHEVSCGIFQEFKITIADLIG